MFISLFSRVRSTANMDEKNAKRNFNIINQKNLLVITDIQAKTSQNISAYSFISEHHKHIQLLVYFSRPSPPYRTLSRVR